MSVFRSSSLQSLNNKYASIKNRSLSIYSRPVDRLGMHHFAVRTVIDSLSARPRLLDQRRPPFASRTVLGHIPGNERPRRASDERDEGTAPTTARAPRVSLLSSSLSGFRRVESEQCIRRCGGRNRLPSGQFAWRGGTAYIRRRVGVAISAIAGQSIGQSFRQTLSRSESPHSSDATTTAVSRRIDDGTLTAASEVEVDGRARAMVING